MNWMVTWIVYTMVLVSCPDQVNIPDEFGVTQPTMVTTTLACYDTIKEPMQREFATKGEAESFIERGKRQYPNPQIMFLGARAGDWKLLEVKR